MHLDEEQVQRLLHNELSPAAERAAREHQAACPDCQRLLSVGKRADDELKALLRLVDHPAPRVTAGMIAARASSRAPAWSRRAAAAVLLLGLAGTTYAIPESPLRGWLRAATQRMTPRQDHAPAAPGALPAPAPDVAGIAVAPGRQFIITFASPQAAGQARVTLTS